FILRRKQTEPARPGVLGGIGRPLLNILQILGESAFVLLGALRRLRPTRQTWTRILAQLVRTGTETLPITFLVSLFVGMVLVVQAADQIDRYTHGILGCLVVTPMAKEP